MGDARGKSVERPCAPRLSHRRQSVPLSSASTRLRLGFCAAERVPGALAWGVLRLVERNETEDTMLWTLVAVLLVLWVLGLATSYTMGGLLHILLLVALVVAVMQLLSGRRTV
jgi:hypothetical protein